MPYKNKKKEMKNRKKYYSKNKIKILQNKKEYYSKNKTKIKEYREKYSFNRNKKCDICKKRIHYKSKFCHSCANRISHQEEKNPMWKGDDVGIGALHEWIKRRKPKPKLCEDCKINTFPFRKTKLCECCKTNTFPFNRQQKYCKYCSIYISRYIGHRVTSISSQIKRTIKILKGCKKC